jgi:hypothetical protein
MLIIYNKKIIINPRLKRTVKQKKIKLVKVNKNIPGVTPPGATNPNIGVKKN